jgi:hypothetical protein
VNAIHPADGVQHVTFRETPTWDFSRFICQLITHLDDTPHHSITTAALSTPTALTSVSTTMLENDT